MTVIYRSLRSSKGAPNKGTIDAIFGTDIKRELALASAAMKRAHNEMARARRKFFQVVWKTERPPDN